MGAPYAATKENIKVLGRLVKEYIDKNIKDKYFPKIDSAISYYIKV